MIQFHELPACAEYYRQPALENAIGFIPQFLNERDPRPARDQINTAYIDGWRPFKGFRKGEEITVRRLHEPDDLSIPVLRYLDDPAIPPLAYAQLRDELIVVYQSAWVAIVQLNGDFEVARLD